MALDTLANQLAINPQALDAVRVQAKKGDTKEGDEDHKTVSADVKHFALWLIVM